MGDISKRLIDENTDIQNILISIKEDIKENIDIYKQTLKKEKQIVLNEEELNSLLNAEISNNYGNIEQFKNEYGIVMKNKVPYGNVLAVYDGDFFVTIELVLKTITTRNILKIKPCRLQVTNLILIERVNNILAEYGIIDRLELVTDEKIEDVDLILHIGEYFDLNFKIPENVPAKKIEYNEAILYVEDLLDKELLQKVKEKYAYIIAKDTLDIGDIYDKKVKDVEEAIKIINKEYKRNSVGIMCKNSDINGYFIEKVYSENVFVNASPTLIKKFFLNCDNLVYSKNICVYRN